jgi:peptidoglycan/LPS O-acetylase OafA/YrhL
VRSHKTSNYRPDIDGIRAIAVLSVIAFHAFPSLVPGGFVGVDIFFVISGFLITQIIVAELDNGNFRIRNFYSRRIRRIIPSLLIALLVALILGWVLLLPEDFSQFGSVLAGSSVFITNFVLFAQVNYFDAAAVEKPLLHLWSLSIEEQFYIFWPIILFTIYK